MPSSTTSHVAKVYAEELISLGHGFAMWVPEPLAAGEIQMGDVGYIEVDSMRVYFVEFPPT